MNYRKKYLKKPITYIGVIYIFLLYVYLFQPPVINKIYFVVLESFIFIYFFISRAGSLLRIFKVFKIEVSIIILIAMYALLRDLMSSEIVYSDRFIVWGFQSFFFGAVILLYFDNKSTTLISLLYWTTFLAALISVALLLFPSFDGWYKAIQIDSYYERYENFEHRYRAYGVSENLTFTYAAVTGMFAGYSLLLLKKSHWYIVPLSVLLLATVFNARIGLIPILFFIIYGITVNKNKIRTVFNFIASSLLLFGLVYMYLDYIEADLDNLIIFSNMDWLMNAFYDLTNSNDINETSTLNIIFNDFIILPESGAEFIWGTGESLFGRKSGSSDIGFILQLYYGGIVLLSLIIFFILFSSYRLVRIIGLSHWFTSFYFFVLIILNTKGFIFAATPGGRLFFLLYMYFILEKYRKNRSKYNLN